jgi:membrane AbrB-like protein
MFEAITAASLFIALSAVGWKAFSLLGLPAPEILGAMSFVALGKLCGLDAALPSALETLLTVGVGIIVGTQFRVRLDLRLAREALMTCGWLIVTGLLISRLLTFMGIDSGTALFASLPGGMAEMAVISSVFEADSFKVTLLHASRMISLMIVMPLIIRRLPGADEAPASRDAAAEPAAAGKIDRLAAAVLSLGCASALTRLNVPAGAFIGALFATAAYARLRKKTLRLGGGVKSALECCVGGVVGGKVVKESLSAAPALIGPMLALDALVILSGLSLGWVLSKVSGMDRVSAQLASVPGGFSPFVVLADKLNADVGRVAVFHLCRYLSMVLFSVIQGLCGANGRL